MVLIMMFRLQQLAQLQGQGQSEEQRLHGLQMNFEFGDWTVGHHGLHAVKGETETSSGFTTETIL